MPRLSVVVPTYNRPEKTARCLDSVLGQADGCDVEVVVVDDASSDGTAAVLTRYAGMGAVRIVRHTENRGAPAAKNTGAGASRGEFVSFLDSDDKLLPGALAHLLGRLSPPAAFDILFLGTVSGGDACGTAQRSAAAGRYRYEAYLRALDAIGECLPVVRRTAFLERPYDEDLRGCEGLTYLRLLKRGATMEIDPTPTRLYDTTGDDRLCSPVQLRGRARQLAEGFRRLVEEFGDDLLCFNPVQYDRFVLREVVYGRIAGQPRERRRRAAGLQTRLLAGIVPFLPSRAVRLAFALRAAN